MNTEWKMQTCYTSQTATVRKILGQGYEPYWGYRCTHNDKPDVKMYFRKPPDPIVTDLQMLESEPPVVQVDPKSIEPILNMFAGLLNDVVMDIVAEINKSIPMRAGGQVEVVRLEVDGSKVLEHAGQVDINYGDEVTPEAAEKFMDETFNGDDDGDDLTQEEVEADIQEMREYEEREAPAGDQFRVVDEAPDLPVKARTPKQDEIIDTIRSSANTNITITPVDDDGKVKVLVSDEVIEIYPDGRTKTGKNPAKTSSLAEGV